MIKPQISRFVIRRLLYTILLSVTLLVVVLVVLPRAFAVEVPPTGSPIFIQTNGPASSIFGAGDWYTNLDNDGPGGPTGGGYHYIEINIPCDWPSSESIYIDLFSPEINSNAYPSNEDQPGSGALSTTFELYDLGTPIISPDQPAPGAPTSLFSTDYLPSSSTQEWTRFYTLTPPVACGSYVLRAESRNDNQNGWKVRVGADNDNDPTTDPPPPAPAFNYDNWDNLPGTNDEITIGVTQISYQHSVPGGACLTLYEYVAPGAPSVTFHNFDLDNNLRVRYYAPSAAYDPTAQTGGIIGTLSIAQATWNGGTSTNRGTGDVIPNPESGWWRIVTCTNPDNQFIQEGRFGIPAYLTQPPTPVMEISKDDGQTVVGPNDVLTYTITFTNTSDTTPSPGAALNVVLTDTLPTNTTFLNCAVNTPTGTCSESGGLVTFNINGAINAGATGSAWVAVRVNPAASGTVSNSITLNYEDGLGNPFPPETADDVDLIPLFDLQLSKTDGGIIAVPGGTVTYTLTYSNVGVGNATGVVITETVPANTIFNAGASTAGWSCADGAPAGTNCTIDLFTVPGGDKGSVAFAVTVDDPLPPGVFQIANTAIIGDDGSQGPDPTPGDNIATDTTPVAVPDLQLNKTDGGVATGPGGTIVYTLTYTNISPVNATGVVITETVPVSTTFNAADSAPTTWTCLGGGVAGDTCTTNIGPVAGGTGGSVTFAVTVDDPLPSSVTQIANTARISDDGSQGPDPTPGNNISDDTTPIIVIVDPRITKAANVSQAQPGDPVLFSISVSLSPTSTVAANNVTVTDTLPLQIDLVTYTVASVPPGLVGGTTVTTNTISTVGHPSGVTQTVVSTITVDIPTLSLGQVVTLVVTTTVNNLASPPPVVIENLAVLGFAQGAPRLSPLVTVNVPAPAPSANPTGGSGGGNDDDDDDSSSPPTAPQPPAAAAAAAQPTPALPVAFLPETGLTVVSGPTNAIKGVWLLLSTSGVVTVVFLLWRRNRKLK